MTHKAVITSDIVRSSQMSAKYGRWVIEQIEHKLGTLFGSSAIMESEMYRGDSFQCLLHQPQLALKAALILKTYIKSLSLDHQEHSARGEGISFIKQRMDVRMSLAVGKIETETGNIGTSNGEAFRLSGRRLDEMKKMKQSFSMTSADPYEQELSTEAMLINFILSKTTALQCQVIQLKLEGLTEMGIADKLRVHQSAINQRATSGGWHALEVAVKRFETIYANG
jgi:hypothetical protein